MAHYYAFCEVHKKFGKNRETEEEAWEDCIEHEENAEGPHIKVYPIASSNKMVNGKKVYRYKRIKNR